MSETLKPQYVICSSKDNHVYLPARVKGSANCEICRLLARIEELEGRSDALHESWEEASREVLLDGLRWQGAMTKALMESQENLGGQIAKLATFIMEEIPGEPCESEGAVDCAIRIMRKQLTELSLLRATTVSLQKQLADQNDPF